MAHDGLKKQLFESADWSADFQKSCPQKISRRQKPHGNSRYQAIVSLHNFHYNFAFSLVPALAIV